MYLIEQPGQFVAAPVDDIHVAEVRGKELRRRRILVLLPGVHGPGEGKELVQPRQIEEEVPGAFRVAVGNVNALVLHADGALVPVAVADVVIAPYGVVVDKAQSLVRVGPGVEEHIEVLHGREIGPDCAAGMLDHRALDGGKFRVLQEPCELCEQSARAHFVRR